MPHPFVFESIIKQISSNSTDLELVLTPVEKNLGVSLGNTLRRTLFGFTPGCAVTSLQIKGASHEFSSIPGMKEETVDFLMNIKSMNIQMDHYGPRSIYINKKGPAVITAEDIVCFPDVRILNRDQYLCTLNETAQLNIRMTVEAGVGYIPAAYHSNRAHPENEIFMDVSFCPVTHVCYHIKHFTFYEEVILHVQTNGSVSPIEVVKHSLAILRSKI